MSMYYEGIGQLSLSFAQEDELAVGQVCQLAEGGKVAACGAGEHFHGVVDAVRGALCGVTMRGAVRVAYSGSALAVGWAKLSADGNGGVKADEAGHEYLVLHVDSDMGTVVLFL